MMRARRFLPISLAPLALLGAGLLLAQAAGPAAQAADDAAKLAATCAEAEERYVELFGAPSAAAEGVTVVKMYKFTFCPIDIVVPVGTTVRWVNVDKRTSHSVIVDGEPESDRAFPGEVIEFTFLTAAPPEEYLCGPHWERRGMIGMVTVTE